MQRTVQEIADQLGLAVVGDGGARVTGFAGIREAGPNDITFCADPKFEPLVPASAAAAVLVRPGFSIPSKACLLRAEDPYFSFIQVLRMFQTEALSRPEGVHPSAVIHPEAKLGEGVSIGPMCVVEAGAVLGARSVLVAGVYVGEDAVMGEDCLMFPNVTLRERIQLGNRVMVHSGSVLGSDGFGYLFRDRCHEKIPQMGTVIVEDDVEIGSNVAVDRGTLGATRIRRGVKIDNLVHIAHNVVIGEDALLVAQVGVSGSTTIGPRSVLAGQAGIVGHIEVGEGSQVGAQAGVTKSVPPRSRVSGYPAMEHDRARKLIAYYRRLPAIVDKIKRLEDRVRELEQDREKVL